MKINNLEKLTQEMPPKWRKKIQEKFGCSKTLVSLVFKGKRQNDEMVDYAIQLKEEYKAKIAEINRKIEEL